MQGRLVFRNKGERERAEEAGITSLDTKYSMLDMASGDVMFAATGVTDGSMLDGIHLMGDMISTHTVVMRSLTGTVRWIRAHHKRNLKSSDV